MPTIGASCMTAHTCSFFQKIACACFMLKCLMHFHSCSHSIFMYVCTYNVLSVLVHMPRSGQRSTIVRAQASKLRILMSISWRIAMSQSTYWSCCQSAQVQTVLLITCHIPRPPLSIDRAQCTLWWQVSPKMKAKEK